MAFSPVKKPFARSFLCKASNTRSLLWREGSWQAHNLLPGNYTSKHWSVFLLLLFFLHFSADYSLVNYTHYHLKKYITRPSIQIKMQFRLVFTHPQNTMISMLPSASSGENTESHFFPDITQLLHIFLHLISNVLPLKLTQLHRISATCQNLFRLSFHETPYLTPWPM